MNVTEAVATRKSVRAFTTEPVANELVADLLTKAARAPSGGNLQPWRMFIISGETMPKFQNFIENSDIKDSPAYAIYPQELKSPYRDSRFKVGEDMYALLGIPREDKPARFAHLARNYEFFDAPVGLFCFVDKQMGPPQWSDLGMFLQTFMLLAREAGLDTCAQEAWAMRANTVSAFVGANEDLMLFCGMALGYQDQDKPVNTLTSDREPLDVWAKFL
jgi:nitroreductase